MVNYRGTVASIRLSRGLAALVLCVICTSVVSGAQNPVPQIVGPVKPSAVTPGSSDFILCVYGANFARGAVVNWNGSPRSTTFVSGHEVQAQILASDVAQNGAGLISVTNPAPGGGNSSASWAQVEVHAPSSTIALNKSKAYPIGDWALMTADFNHDGTLDFVGQYGNDLLLYPGKGDGSFHFGSIAGQPYDSTTQAAYGDFNGDGNLDVVFVAGLGINQPTQMTVMLSDGNGRFHVGSRIKDYAGFGTVTVGDFNRDGKLDLMVRGRQLSLFLGNGDGTFTHFKDYPYSTLTAQMIAGDFNGDGNLDLLLFQTPLPNNNNMGMAFYILLGNGDGSFRTPQLITSFSNTLGCVSGAFLVSDFNADGKLDFAFCDQLGQLGVVLGNGDGSFQQPLIINSAPLDFTIGDFNSDGKSDLIEFRYYQGLQAQVVAHLGNGDGTFQPPQIISPPLPYSELGMSVGDFNSDGLLDFAAQSPFGLNLFLQQ